MDIETLIQELQRIQFAKENINTNVIDITLPTYSGGNNGITLIVRQDLEAIEAAKEASTERMVHYGEWFEEAKDLIDYYNHEDFVGNYEEIAVEVFQNEATANKKRVLAIFQAYIFRNATNKIDPAIIEANYEEICDFVSFNCKFRRYRGYYSCQWDLESISFGEQEEPVVKWTEDKQLAYENAGYCVNEHDKEGFYAYYDMSSDGVSLYMNYEGDELTELLEIAGGAV